MLAREIGFDEGALIVGKDVEHVEVLVLTDDLSVKDMTPPTRLRVVIIELDDVLGLQAVLNQYSISTFVSIRGDASV